MLNLALLLDQFLLNKFQKVSDWLQERTGWNCFVVAAWCYQLIFAVFYVGIFLHPNHKFLEEGFEKEFIKVLAVLILSSPFMGIMVVIRRFEKRITQAFTPESRARNPLEDRQPWRFIRLGIVVMCCGYLSSSLGHLIRQDNYYWLTELGWSTSAILEVSYIYFSSCTPKPPKRQEKKEETPDGAIPEAV